MKIKLLSTLLLVLTQTFIFSQTTKEYQSTKSGLWNNVFNWQYFDGSSSLTLLLNSPQRYSDRCFVTAGAVFILSGIYYDYYRFVLPYADKTLGSKSFKKTVLVSNVNNN